MYENTPIGKSVRRRPTRVVCLLVVALLFTGTQLIAQGLLDDFECGDALHPGESWESCSRRYSKLLLREAGVDLLTQMRSRAQDDLATDIAAGDTTSKRDFLNLLLASIAGDNFQDSNGDLRLAYNFEPDLFAGKGVAGLSLEVVARDPEVFDQLLEQVPEGLRATLKASLEEELEDLDDVEWKVLLSFKGHVKGTTFGQRVTGSFNLIVETLSEEVPEEIKSSLEQTLLQLRGRGLRADEQPMAESVAELRGTSPEVASQFEDALKQAVTDRLDASGLLTEQAFSRLGDLEANQPQFYLTLSTRNRDDLVGTDEKSVKLSYEFGTGTVNGLMRGCKEKNRDDALALDCFSFGLLQPPRGLMRKPFRLKLEAEYLEVDAYDFEVMLPETENGAQDAGEGEMEPAPTASLALDRVQKLVAGLTISKVLKLTDDSEKAQLKLDLDSKYEDISDDPMRQDRWVSTLTLSQRVGDDTSLAVSLVYANKPEFRGMVDEELSARAGLKFKVDRGNKKTN